jgi:hypothetical protein
MKIVEHQIDSKQARSLIQELDAELYQRFQHIKLFGKQEKGVRLWILGSLDSSLFS